MYWLPLLVYLEMVATGCAEELDSISSTLKVVEKWLPNEALRQELTHLYLQEHFDGEVPTDIKDAVLMEPKMVVLHWTGASTMMSSWYTFAAATLSGRKDLHSGGALNVGAHFIVDRDGTVYQLLPENRIARHCIGVNHLAIGIENVGGGKSLPLTQAQVDANIALISELRTRHQIDMVIGHYEIGEFETHSYFSEKDPKYRSSKIDPGEEFTHAVRRGLQKNGIIPLSQ